MGDSFRIRKGDRVHAERQRLLVYRAIFLRPPLLDEWSRVILALSLEQVVALPEEDASSVVPITVSEFEVRERIK